MHTTQANSPPGLWPATTEKPQGTRIRQSHRMRKKEEKVAAYFELRPLEYPVVEELRLNQGLSGELNIALTMMSRKDVDPTRLHLTFSKVKKFRLDIGPSELYFTFLNIMPMNDQWEDVNYKVFEDDQGTDFSLLCDDFDAELLTNSSK
jgi:hypothetical protein